MISFDSPRDGNKIPFRTWMTFLDRIDVQQLAIDSSVSRGMSHLLAGSCNPIAITIRYLFKCSPLYYWLQRSLCVSKELISAAKETAPFVELPQFQNVSLAYPTCRHRLPSWCSRPRRAALWAALWTGPTATTATCVWQFGLDALWC